jgi:hypothetical protein
VCLHWNNNTGPGRARECRWGGLEHLSSLIPNLGFGAGHSQTACLRTCPLPECQAYVGIFGTQYGTLLPGSKISQLELEWVQASEAGIPSLIYLLDETKQPVLPSRVDKGSSAELLGVLKERIVRHRATTSFTSPEDLAYRLLVDLPSLLEGLGLRVDRGKLDATVRSLSAADWLLGTRLKLFRHALARHSANPPSDEVLRKVLRYLIIGDRQPAAFYLSRSSDFDLKQALVFLEEIEETLARLVDHGNRALQRATRVKNGSPSAHEESRYAIVLCGSMSHFPLMERYRDILLSRRIPAIAPEEESIQRANLDEDSFSSYKRVVSARYLTKIRRRNTQGILVVNETKHGDPNYIGANTFAEIAVAFNARKKIYLLKDIPDTYADELIAWNVIPLYGRLDALIADFVEIVEPRQYALLDLFQSHLMLNTPSPQSIARSGVLDHCNTLTALTFKHLGLDSATIRVEAAVRQFPQGLGRAIFFGQEDVRAIVADASIQLECISDGSCFAENEPVLALTGRAAILRSCERR